MSRTGAHLRLQLEEFPAVMVCDLRLDVSGLTVLRYFLEITVVHSGKVVLPVIDFGDISRMAGVGEDVEAEVVAASVTFSEESTGSSDDTRVVICVESSDTESKSFMR